MAACLGMLTVRGFGQAPASVSWVVLVFCRMLLLPTCIQAVGVVPTPPLAGCADMVLAVPQS